MGATSIPAISPKTRYVVTLTSGVSWTVPAGVTYVNATLFGGGQAGFAPGSAGGTDYGQVGRAGNGGQVIATNVSTTPGAAVTYAVGAGGTGNGGSGGNTTFTGATTASGASSTGAVGQSAGNGGLAGNYVGSPVNGGAGGSGKIEIEYWV
jgi:hypothetical protein